MMTKAMITTPALATSTVATTGKASRRCLARVMARLNWHLAEANANPLLFIMIIHAQRLLQAVRVQQATVVWFHHIFGVGELAGEVAQQLLWSSQELWSAAARSAGGYEGPYGMADSPTHPGPSARCDLELALVHPTKSKCVN